MRDNMFNQKIHTRIKITLLIIICCFIAIIFKVFYIQVFDYQKLNTLANKLWNRNLTIGANRGKIITCGVDGGTISSLTYNASKDEYTMNYSNGWQFWSVQLFFDLPYAEQGDTYHFAWDVNSDVAGQMTISGHAVDLQQGDNYINFDVTQGSGALISIQFGVNGGTNLGGEVLKFSPFRLYDADAAHKYHHVTFVNGTETLKDIYVRDGKTVVAPEVTVTGNYLFQGFFEGTTPYQTGLAVTKDYAFVASIVEKSAENTKHVTIKLGSKNTIYLYFLSYIK